MSQLIEKAKEAVTGHSRVESGSSDPDSRDRSQSNHGDYHGKFIPFFMRMFSTSNGHSKRPFPHVNRHNIAAKYIEKHQRPISPA